MFWASRLGYFIQRKRNEYGLSEVKRFAENGWIGIDMEDLTYEGELIGWVRAIGARKDSAEEKAFQQDKNVACVLVFDF